MSQTPTSSGPPSTAILRAAAVLVLVLALAATGLQVMGALAAMRRADMAGPAEPLFAPAAVTLMLGVALVAALEGIARGVARPAGDAGGDAVAPAIGQLADAIADLRSSLLPEPSGTTVTSHSSTVVHAVPGVFYDPHAQPLPAPVVEPLTEEVVEADFEPVSEPAAVVPAESHLGRIVQLLEELKELALLDDAQRQARGNMSKERRKLERVDEAASLIARNEWEQADALLTLLESLHPGDPNVLARRNELDDVRGAARDAEWAQRVRQVEDLLALSRYDEAAAVIAGFRETYPSHVDAAGLSVQIAADREAYVERTAAALFNEIKTAVDARQWRMALDGTQRFLTRFPDNVRSDRIRQQVRTIQKNAEIEERHENEERIKDLARSGRFAEAADLCEELLTRFPASPQAGSLRNLLPRLRERSAMAEAAVE